MNTSLNRRLARLENQVGQQFALAQERQELFRELDAGARSVAGEDVTFIPRPGTETLLSWEKEKK